MPTPAPAEPLFTSSLPVAGVDDPIAMFLVGKRTSVVVSLMESVPPTVRANVLGDGKYIPVVPSLINEIEGAA